MARKKSSESIESTIFSRIKRCGLGTVVLPTHFLDLGTREAVGISLYRLAKSGDIRRIARGVYDYPIIDPLLGELTPTIEAITKALTHRDKIRLQPSGAYALNLLGLSEQVPAKIVFLTEGESRKLKIGPMEIELRRTTPKNMASAGRLSGLVIQAFRALGKDHVTPERIEQLKATIPLKERETLLKDIPLAPAWMHSIFREIAEDES
jgi:hypothetical protein